MKSSGSRVLSTITLMAFVFMAGRVPAMPAEADGGSDEAAKDNDRVCVDYVGTFPDGQVFDTSIEQVAKDMGLYNPQRGYEPLCFTVGAHQVVPGFENAVLGMKVGETKEVTIPPEQAYGERKAELIMQVPMATFGGKPNIDEVYGFTDSRSGQVIPGRVDSVDEASGMVNVDFNSEMAGKTLQFKITLKNIG